MAEVIREKYVSKYPAGICLALRTIMGDSKFATEFGATTAEEALRKCIDAGRDNAARQFDKWATVWPSRMANYLLRI
jgi:hypothetical protein